jgi:bacillithiol biosynthesis deacetylase BshB1
MSGIDFLCVGAHADDIEISMGGTVAKMVALGRMGLLVDVTDASMGTRGTPEERLHEASEAARIVGIGRRNLGFPDGSLRPLDADLVRELGALFRELRPNTVFTHPTVDRHPDHEAVASCVREAAFKAGLVRWTAPGDAWRPRRVFHWMGARDGEPTFCVDVTEHWETRLRALAAYRSQFGTEGTPTALSDERFPDFLRSRARFLGSRARCRYAEGFTCEELPEVADPCALSGEDF